MQVIPLLGPTYRALALGVGVLMLLAPLGAQPRIEENRGDFVGLIEAVRVGDLSGIEHRLQAGTDINRLGGNEERGYRYPALFHALHARQWAAATLLISRGADVSTMIEKQAPFSLAAGFGSIEVARQIWARLPEAERRRLLTENDSWVTALEFGHLDVVRDLQALGFALQDKERGAVALHAAVGSGRADCVDYVLGLKISPNERKDAATALARAAGQGHVEIIERLLAAGADIDAISPKLPDVTYWFKGEVTALMAAVIKGEPEAVAALLKHRASPALLDNGAIRWADLMGDEESFRLLRNAGAPEPVAFSFREWLAEGDRANISNNARRGVLAADIAHLLASAPIAADENPTALARSTRLAIVPLSAGLEAEEGLLAARLSRLNGAVLLERAEVRRIINERTLTQGFGRTPSENSRLGGLLGADALVFLQVRQQGKQAIMETRVVSVTTGLVTSVQLSARDGKSPEPWADTTVRQCAADVNRIFTSPRDAKLVAVMPLTASTSGVEARETESRLTLLLASQLARLPGVFLLERGELDRLRAEGGAVDQELLKSSWLVSGSVEVIGAQAGREAENVLSLRLEPGLRGKVQSVRLTGPASGPVALVRAVVNEVGAVLSVETDGSWNPLHEAEAYFAKGRAFADSRMWVEAQAAMEAAWALGLQSDAVQKERINTAAKRALFSATNFTGKTHGPIWVRDFTGSQRGVIKEVTLRDVIVDRAPLSFPSGDDRELVMDDYLELAERILDWLDRGLSIDGGQVRQADFQSLVVGPVWDAATLPLQLGEALSYQHNYRLEYAELRSRLLAVNTRALGVAKARGFKNAHHTLQGIRCRLMAWWQPDEALFTKEIRQVLHEARESKPVVSGHPVWGSALRSGLAQMDLIGGRASQAWVRMARVLVKSTDAEERLLGLAWLSRELSPGPAERIRVQLQAEFSSVLESDQAWTGTLWEMAYDASLEPGPYRGPVDVAPWYGDALRFSRVSQPKISIVATCWDAGADGLRELPEQRAFDFKSFERKAALIQERGPSCLLWHYSTFDGFSDIELQRIVHAVERTVPVINEVRKNPDAKNYYLSPQSWLARLNRALTDQKLKLRLAQTPSLKFGPPRWFFPEKQVTTVDGDPRASVIDYFGYQFNGEAWWRAVSPGYTQTTIFRFGPDGRPENPITHVNRQDGGFYTIGESRGGWSVHRGGDVVEDYIAVQAKGQNQKGGARMNECVRLYDRREGTWITLAPPFPVNMIVDVRILAGNVYFSFLYNPETEKTPSLDWMDYARKGEPTWGVAEYCIARKSYRLLASSRRNPAESPADGNGNEYGELNRISPTEMVVGRDNKWVYDVTGQLWRKSTASDIAAVKAATVSPLEIEAGGDIWVVTFSSGSKITFSRKNINQGKRPSSIKLPVEMDMGGGGVELDPALVRRVEEVNRYEFYGTPYGIALTGRNFYAWVPLNELKPVVEEAVRRLVD